MANKSTPRHVGFIPDGNRRWAMDHGLPKEAGYAQGINPGLLLYEKCKECGIKEMSIYGFTQDNTKRPSIQKQAFSEACVAFAFEIEHRGAALLIVGDETSKQFPKVLREFRQRQGVGMKVNLLINYGWEWDLAGLTDRCARQTNGTDLNFFFTVEPMKRGRPPREREKIIQSCPVCVLISVISVP